MGNKDKILIGMDIRSLYRSFRKKYTGTKVKFVDFAMAILGSFNLSITDSFIIVSKDKNNGGKFIES
ncbi:hypothetical protein HCA15_03700 [Listeria booriae]|uniref:hypothetical protein n=1 Tax=Listeria booriae TaxID=1552123 RepID=UPI00164E0D81|nr:hypothetical protein [Listeria booriae]MBC6165741.1 hypothetical protein [Listeria booriae]